MAERPLLCTFATTPRNADTSGQEDSNRRPRTSTADCKSPMTPNKIKRKTCAEWLMQAAAGDQNDHESKNNRPATATPEVRVPASSLLVPSATDLPDSLNDIKTKTNPECYDDRPATSGYKDSNFMKPPTPAPIECSDKTGNQSNGTSYDDRLAIAGCRIPSFITQGATAPSDDFDDIGLTETDFCSNLGEAAQEQKQTPRSTKPFLKRGQRSVIPPSTPRPTAKSSLQQSTPQSPATPRTPRRSKSTVTSDQSVEIDLDSPKQVLAHGLQKLASSDWDDNIDGFLMIEIVIREYQEYLASTNPWEWHNVIELGLHQLGNLRSQVCRAACKFFKDVFTEIEIECLKKIVERDLDKISGKLLDKTMDTNRFIRDDSDAALNAMIWAMPATKCINTLEICGSKHNNALVRKTTARLLDMIVQDSGPERILMHHGDKVLPMLVRFLQEGSLETRAYAKSSLATLVLNPSFDSQLRRTIHCDTFRHVEKSIIALKNEVKAKVGKVATATCRR